MSEETFTRTFICIELPDHLKQKIGSIEGRLKPMSTGVTWVRPENIHLTLNFLGNVEESRLTGIREAVTEVSSRYSILTLVPEGLGVFPNTKNPRVFWLGIRDESERLNLVQADLEAKLAELGFPPEGRVFRPHLTIGRVRPYRKARELSPAFLSLTFSDSPFEVSHLTVMKSDLRPTGAIYTPLHVARLRPGQTT